MRRYIKIIFTSSIAVALLSACTGVGASPYSATQTGAATGAVAGSVIGYNTTGHHKGQRAVIGGLLGAAVGTGVGNAIDEQNQPVQNNGGWE
jgi:uncharacterized protein YcfJ